MATAQKERPACGSRQLVVEAAHAGRNPVEGGSPLDKNWGRPFEEQKYSQIIDHEAGKNLDPILGLDGKAAVNTVERYQKSFKGEKKGGPKSGWMFKQM